MHSWLFPLSLLYPLSFSFPRFLEWVVVLKRKGLKWISIMFIMHFELFLICNSWIRHCLKINPLSLKYFVGARMLYNTQEMLLRRKLEEQVELQQAIELQGRRMMNLQLPDLNDRMHHHHRSLSVGSPVPLPPQPDAHINQNVTIPSDCSNQEIAEGKLWAGSHLI